MMLVLNQTIKIAYSYNILYAYPIVIKEID